MLGRGEANLSKYFIAFAGWKSRGNALLAISLASSQRPKDMSEQCDNHYSGNKDGGDYHQSPKTTAIFYFPVELKGQ